MASTTIRSLAAEAGVSAATVSLALRDHPRISPAVRQRIRELADSAGYRTNPAVSRLLSRIRVGNAAAFQGTIGILYTSRESSDMSAPSVREWVGAAKARAAELGYRVDEFILHEGNMNTDRLVRILDTRGIRGVLVTGPFGGKPLPRELDRIWQRSSTVVLGERPLEPELSCALNNQFLTVTASMRRVAALGYRRPGLCVHPDVDEVTEHRFLGGYLAAQALLPAADRLPVFPYASDARRPFVMWFRKHRPDVILTIHAGIRSWLEHEGVGIPDDAGLLHLDRTNDLDGWAGMHQDNEHLGAAAVEMLLSQMYFNVLGTPPFQNCLFLGGRWINGTTLRKAAPRASSTVNSSRSGRRRQSS
jgi:DNA-binding LacI/PurR family transcriptional regulator